MPGNHDVWTRPNVEGDTSLLKLQDLIEVAGVCGVHMGPITVYSSELSRNILHVIPLYSWYHSDWDTERDIPRVEVQKCPYCIASRAIRFHSVLFV